MILLAFFRLEKSQSIIPEIAQLNKTKNAQIFLLKIILAPFLLFQSDEKIFLLLGLLCFHLPALCGQQWLPLSPPNILVCESLWQPLISLFSISTRNCSRNYKQNIHE